MSRNIPVGPISRASPFKEISMMFMAVFQRDAHHEGVRRISIYLLRLVYVLMFLVLGKDTWTQILTHQGPWQPTSVVRLDSFRDIGGLGNHPAVEDAADFAAGNILQSPVAHYRGVPTLVKGHLGGLTGGKHHLFVLVGDLADRCSAVGVCVCELHLPSQKVEPVTCSWAGHA
jgi:hypothetical protein